MAARSLDLGDVTIIVAADDTADDLAEQGNTVALLPRSPEMFALLDRLPKVDPWDEDDEEED